MKKITATSRVVIVLLLCLAVRNKASAQPGVQVSYQMFYDELQPYGQWMDYPGYGYVWQPSLGAGFRPYSTGGHWVMTVDFGWTWLSDYDWGWAPFHYGRWMYDEYYGWLWVPGYEWSPAWVVWRGGGDYYGWAPLQPGINININFSIGRYAPPSNYWCFVPRRHITSTRLHNYYISPSRNTTIIHNTTIINNYERRRNVFVTGPGRREVERYTNRPVRPAIVRESSRPGRTSYRNNQVNIYRPGVQQSSGRREAPRRLGTYTPGRRDNISRNNRFENRQRNPEIRQRSSASPAPANRPGSFGNRNARPDNRRPQANNNNRPDRMERPGGQVNRDRMPVQRRRIERGPTPSREQRPGNTVRQQRDNKRMMPSARQSNVRDNQRQGGISRGNKPPKTHERRKDG